MMSNSEFDKGAALDILRYTVKVAAAPAVGGQAGPPQPGAGMPGMPGGGQTIGGSASPGMQTGWAAGAMRQNLVKTFRANSARTQRQGVHVAAKRTGGMGSGTSGVGGMGSGLSKGAMVSIGSQLEKTSSLPGAFLRGASFFGRGAQAAKKVSPIREAVGKGISRAGEALKRARETRRLKGSRLTRQSASEVSPEFSKALDWSGVPRGAGSAYVDPRAAASGLAKLNPFGKASKGTGLRNVYKNTETGKLVLGPRGPFGKTLAPKGHELAKRYTSTGGMLQRMGKRGLDWGAKGGVAGYGGSFIANPGDWGSARQAWHSIKDPRRRQMAMSGAAFGATAPSLVAPLLLGDRMFTPGAAAATSLATRSGGRWAPGASSGGGIRGALSGHISRTTKQRKISKLEKLEAVAKKNREKKARQLSSQPAPQHSSQALSQTLSSTR